MLRHAAEAASGTFYRGAEGGEDFGLCGEMGILVRVFERGLGREGRGRGKEPYAIINDMLVAGIIIYVYCDAAEGGDFGGELIEAGVVLSVLSG